MAYIGNSPYQGSITGGNIVDGSIESIDLATLTNIDINSGSIDGTVIGASSPALGAFSSVGVGTSSPTISVLHLNYNSVNNRGIRLQDENGIYDLITSGGSNNNSFGIYNDTAGAYRLFINSSGNVGIGTSSISNSLGWGSVVQVGGDNPALSLRNTGGNQWDISNFGGTFNIYNGSDPRLRIDSNGALLVSKQADDATTVGTRLGGNYIFQVGDGTPCIYMNRKTSYGQVAVFRSDNNDIGAIRMEGGRLVIASDNGSSGCGVYFDTGEVMPTNRLGGLTDAQFSLGSSSYRWNNLYLSGGVYLGGTGAANHLDDYEEGTWTPTAIGQSGGSLTLTPYGAHYTKIGDTVHVFIEQLQWTAKTTIVGSLKIGGLPFVAKTGTRSSTGGMGGASSGSFSFTGQPFVGVDGASDFMWAMFRDATNGTYTHMTDTHLGATGIVYGVSITYKV